MNHSINNGIIMLNFFVKIIDLIDNCQLVPGARFCNTFS